MRVIIANELVYSLITRCLVDPRVHNYVLHNKACNASVHICKYIPYKHECPVVWYIYWINIKSVHIHNDLKLGMTIMFNN